MPSRHAQEQLYHFYNQHLHTPDNDNKSLHLSAIPVEDVHLFGHNNKFKNLITDILPGVQPTLAQFQIPLNSYVNMETTK